MITDDIQGVRRNLMDRATIELTAIDTIHTLATGAVQEAQSGLADAPMAMACSLHALDPFPSLRPEDPAVPADVLAAALFARLRAWEKRAFDDKRLSMRFGFGGHAGRAAER